MSNPPALPGSVKNALQRHRRNRLGLLLLAGVVACAAALAVRNSTWARERYLGRLSSRSLSLLALEHPGDPRIFEHLGKKLSAEGDMPGSLQAFQRAVELNPRLADAQLGLGYALLQVGRPHDAERCLVEAAKLRANDPAPHFMLAELYGRYRNTTATIAPLEKVTELDPQDAEAWHRLGVAYVDLHQWDQGLAALEKAAELNNRRADYHRDLAQVQMHFGKTAEARRSLESARDIDPRDKGTLVLLARVELDAGASTDLMGAQRLVEAALKIDPLFAPAHRELGVIYLRRGQVKPAINSLRKAVEYDRSDGQALFQLGQALIRDGRRAEGDEALRGFRMLTEAHRTVRDLEDRIHQDPKNPELRLRMARVYRQYGRDDHAINQYQVYLSMQSSDVKVQNELRDYVSSLRKSGKQPQPQREGA